ncbi:hypothetical protein MCEREM21A_02420 [Sphingomonadaceae bacterium]
MNNYTRKGIIFGLIFGVITAVVNWEGKPIVAASSILFATMIGWLIGSYLGKRKRH